MQWKIDEFSMDTASNKSMNSRLAVTNMNAFKSNTMVTLTATTNVGLFYQFLFMLSYKNLVI